MADDSDIYEDFHQTSELFEPPIAPNRLLSVEKKLYRYSLVGSYFHSDSGRSWQGCVVAEPRPGVYLVELFSWFLGESTHQELVSLVEMAGWQFYDDNEWLLNSSKSVQARWERERQSAPPPEVPS